jgi:hypothetical protein
MTPNVLKEDGHDIVKRICHSGTEGPEMLVWNTDSCKLKAVQRSRYTKHSQSKLQ